jgi:hypothetical protein
MKVIKIFYLLLLFVPVVFHAQSDKTDEKREKIKAFKVSFLTSELELTSAEAQKFWPIYNAYDEKQFELRYEKMMSYMRKIEEETNSMSEKDAALLLTQIINTDKELYILRERYMANLRKVLSAKKILKLKKSEDDFNRKLLKQYRDKAKN